MGGEPTGRTAVRPYTSAFCALERFTMFKSIARLMLLFLTIALVLFPFVGLGKGWAEFGNVFHAIFPTRLEHTVGHLLSFFTLGLVVLSVFPSCRLQPRLYLGLMLAAGLGQEIFQLPFKHILLSVDDGYDLTIDLLGASMAWLAVIAWHQVRRQREKGQTSPRSAQ
jgi:hypothetical protein